MKRLLLIVSIVTLLLTPQLGVASELVLPSALNAGWLATMNYYRLSSGVPPVTEDPSLSNSAAKHVNYLLKTDPSLMTGAYASKHTENPASPYYSVEGANSRADIAWGCLTETECIDQWMTAPFHAVGILRDNLKVSGFAMASGGPNRSTAVLDVINGLVGTRQSVIMFPGNNAITRLNSFRGESPDPRESCGADYKAFTGLPIWISLLSSPTSTLAASLSNPDGTTLSSSHDLCVVDEWNFHSADPIYGPAGSSIITADHMVILIPRNPLAPGPYHVTINQQGRPDISWSFHVIAPPSSTAWTYNDAKEEVTWQGTASDPVNPILNYDVRFSPFTIPLNGSWFDAIDPTTATSFTTTSTSLDVSGFASGSYELCIAAISAYLTGDCLPSILTIVRTPPSVDNVSADAQSAATLNWVLPSTPAYLDAKRRISSQIMTIKSDSGTQILNQNLSPGDNKFKVSDLPNGTYTGCLTEVNYYGKSDCNEVDFNVFNKLAQHLQVNYPYVGNLAPVGSSIEIQIPAGTLTSVRAIPTSVCSANPLSYVAIITGFKAGICHVSISNPGDDQYLPLQENINLTFKSITTIKCIKNRKTWLLTSYLPSCPKGYSRK